MQPVTPPKEKPVTYFAKREVVYPKRSKGRFRTLKWTAMLVTLGIYYFAPFIRWDRGPGAPDQAILIDLNHARAYWFFIEIWPQEIYILTGILILAAVSLFFITSLLGRVWCGYFCPQTVWTDLFMWVEDLIQGDRVARRRLSEGPWTFEKIWKKTLTHLVWLLIGLCTAGAFVFYFNDAPTLWANILDGKGSPVVLGFVAGLTFSTYLMAGFAREQVCFYMCPYARFQSGMFDKDTLIIGYDTKRGEPRGHHKKNEGWEGRGHCIDCTACVQACPTGIDIRNGLQMECIACGLCIDACDDIMQKVGLPTGLIRYDTEQGLRGGHKLRMIRPRTLYYTLLLSLVGGVMLFMLATRPLLEVNVLHDRNPLFVRLSGGEIRNAYDVKILNKTHQDRTYELAVEGIEGAQLDVKAAGDVSAADLPVSADSVGGYHLIVTAPAQGENKAVITFRVKDKSNDRTARHQSVFISR